MPAVSAAVYIAVGLVGLPAYVSLVFQSVFYLVFPASAVVMTFVAAGRAHPADRRMWMLMAAGISCLLAGEVVWAARQIAVYPAGQAEAPLSDLLLVLGYVVIGVFVFLLLRERFATLRRLDQIRYALDGLIVLTVSLAAEAILVLQPWLDQGISSYGDVSFVFAWVDMIVVAGFFVVIRSSGQVRGRSWQTMAMIATALGAVSHLLLNILLVRGVYQIGSLQNSLVDVVWMVSYWMLTMAAARFAGGEYDAPVEHVVATTRPYLADFGTVAVSLVFIPAAMWVAHGQSQDSAAYWAWVATATLLTMLVAARGSVVAVSNRELTAISATDPLTGVHNHRYFQEHLDLELGRAIKTNVNLSVVAIDLDDFRSVNEAHGHLAGDQALQFVARVLTDGVRSFTDLPCRVGGDEFSVLLPAADESEAVEVFARIQALLKARQAGAADELTISAGIATFPVHAKTRDALLRAADAALYLAKSKGRDQAAVYDPKDESLRRLPDPVLPVDPVAAVEHGE